MMASSLGAAHRLGAQCASAPLGRQQQRSRAARRRSGIAVATAADNGAWDTLSVDELQEWEVCAMLWAAGLGLCWAAKGRVATELWPPG